MESIINELGIIIYATLTYTPPLLFAALGSCFSENSGVVNIGIEGMMTIGAFFGAAIAHFTGNPWIGFLCGGLAGAALALLHAVASVSLPADQTIVGTAINFLGAGVALLLSKAWFNSSDTPNLLDNKLPNLFSGMFTEGTVGANFLKNVLRNPVSTYLVFLCVILVWFIFYKTRFGLRLMACGEHPQAADSVGINVYKMRYAGVLISGFLAGLGGASITMATMNQFRPTSVVGHGFIAIAAVIFGKFKPQGAMWACLLFGMCTGLRVVLGGASPIPTQLISMIPYVTTVVVLVLFVGKSRAPAANGKPYIKSK